MEGMSGNFSIDGLSFCKLEEVPPLLFVVPVHDCTTLGKMDLYCCKHENLKVQHTFSFYKVTKPIYILVLNDWCLKMSMKRSLSNPVLAGSCWRNKRRKISYKLLVSFLAVPSFNHGSKFFKVSHSREDRMNAWTWRCYYVQNPIRRLTMSCFT